jgi:hypothetical protein
VEQTRRGDPGGDVDQALRSMEQDRSGQLQVCVYIEDRYVSSPSVWSHRYAGH